MSTYSSTWWTEAVDDKTKSCRYYIYIYHIISHIIYLVMLYLLLCFKTYIYKYSDIYIYNQRKFRSQTSGNMDRWKSRGGKSQRGEEQKREDQRRERVRRKKMQAQVREKVAKSRNTVFFQCFVAPEGRKVGSLKRRVRSHVVRWEMNNCTPLWREAHFHVKMYNAHQGLSTLARYKRHAHQRYQEVRVLISWEGLHFGASDLQVC